MRILRNLLRGVFGVLIAATLAIPVEAQSPQTPAQVALATTASPETPDLASSRTPYAPKAVVDEFAPQIRFDVLMVSLDEEKAVALLPELRDVHRIERTQERLLGMVARREAEILGWPEVTAHSGVRAISQMIQEHRHPSGFEQPLQAQNAAPYPAQPQTAEEKAKRILHLLCLPFPSAYEVHNLGTVLAVETAVAPGGHAATLNYAITLSVLEETVEFVMGRDARGKEIGLPQASPRNHRAVGTLTLRDGERRLLHVGKPSESKGDMVLFIAGLKIFPATK